MLQPVPSVYRGSTLLQISGDSSNMLSSTEFPRLSLLLPNCRKEGGGVRAEGEVVFVGCEK